jgi:hypothetical protein
MNELVTHTLQRIFQRTDLADSSTAATKVSERPRRPDFAETRPVVFRSEAFAEDLVVLLPLDA